MAGSDGPVPSLHRLREEGGVVVFGEPRAGWIGILMGYLIAALIGGGFAVSLERASGTRSLLFHGAGLLFIVAWMIGRTRQDFSRRELRMDPRSRRIVRTWSPFLGKRTEEAIEAAGIREVRLERRGVWIVGLVMRDGSFVRLDAARHDGAPLRALADSLQRGLGVPLKVSEEEPG